MGFFQVHETFYVTEAATWDQICFENNIWDGQNDQQRVQQNIDRTETMNTLHQASVTNYMSFFTYRLIGFNPDE